MPDVTVFFLFLRSNLFFVFIQFALRLLAFRQIHKVLGMDLLPQINPRFNIRNSRKRRRDNSDGTDSFEGEGKKDKKDFDGFWASSI